MSDRLRHEGEVYEERAKVLEALLSEEWRGFVARFPRQLDGWTWCWSRSRSRFGSCNYRSRTVRISTRALLDPDTAVALETLRHEVAHVLAGSAAKHGPDWKAWAVICGAEPKSCGRPSPEAEDLPHRWELVCDYPDGTTEIVRKYHARPRRDFRERISSLQLRGKPETRGRLRLRWWNEA